MIKKFIFSLLIVFSLGIASAPHISAQSTNKFDIDSFSADYYLNKDDKDVSRLMVVETITARFMVPNQNHGIERAIPEKYKDNSLDLKVESVKNENGTKWNYSTSTKNDNLVLRIGDANKYVQGTQTYVITYTLRDVATFYQDHDEWYWDVNGDQWKQQFGEVTARIHIPKELATKIKQETKCFTGTYGSTLSECSVVTENNANETLVTVRSARPLTASENLSFVMGFNSGTFTKYKTDLKTVILGIIMIALLAGLAPLIAIIIMTKRWKAGGKDPRGKGVIIPQYTVPNELNPVLADVILNERLQTKSVSATLIHLCVKGYLKLYEIEKKKLIGNDEQYEVELVKSTDGLTNEEVKVVSMLFSNKTVGERVNLNDLKNKLYKDVKTLSSTASIAVTEQGYYTENPETARKKYTSLGIFLLVIGFIPVFIFPPILLGSAGLGIAGVIVLIFGNAMPKRTQKGVDMKEYLLGVKDYMALAEADRIKYLQAPDTAEKIDVSDNKQIIKLYEKLLPYAVLFGIEKQWAKEFANLYGQDQSPGWYNSNHAFNAVLFSSAISSFNTVATSSFSAPSSSGSSGYSGGGGFSGGGGGGGGGGGW